MLLRRRQHRRGPLIAERLERLRRRQLLSALRTSPGAVLPALRVGGAGRADRQRVLAGATEHVFSVHSASVTSRPPMRTRMPFARPAAVPGSMYDVSPAASTTRTVTRSAYATCAMHTSTKARLLHRRIPRGWQLRHALADGRDRAAVLLAHVGVAAVAAHRARPPRIDVAVGARDQLVAAGRQRERRVVLRSTAARAASRCSDR